LANGGWSFACDPDASPITAPAIWRPELCPATLPLDAAPSDFDGVPPLDFAGAGPILADGSASDGRHLIIDDPDGDHRLWLRTAPGAPMAMAMVLPLNDDFELRLGAAARLFRRLRGMSGGPMPPRLAVTAFQRLRLALLLNVFDRLGGGATKREIAQQLIYPGLDPGSAAEWKASAERRRTHRLCDEAKAMVAAGYRRLLGGR
jgi:hypothetical protein